MGHRNIQFTGHMMTSETDQQGHSHLHPEPCIFYGNMPNFPPPNTHAVIPPPNFHHMPNHHENALFYGMQRYNPVPPQYPPANLDLSIGAPSGYYTPYLPPPSDFRDLPVQVNQGSQDHYGRNIPYMDDMRGPFKRKNAEALAGPSSSFAPVTGRPAENGIIDSAPFLPPESASVVESESIGSVRSRPGMYGPESVLVHNTTGQLIQGSYGSPPVHLPGNPWMDMHFGANNGDIGTFAWVQAPNLSYVHANGACVETGNIGMQGFQMAPSNRSSTGLMHPPPIPQGHPNPHFLPQPMQGVRRQVVNFPSQMATSSSRIPTISSSNTGIPNSFHDVIDRGPTFMVPIPPTDFRLYQPHRREIVLDPNARHHSFPHLRVLPEDEVAIMEIPGYHEAVDSVDYHRDMRLDIDQMSYEELLALGEQMGSVGTGLSEEFIEYNLKLRTFTSSAVRANLGEATCSDQQINFCVICQTDYEDEENIGTLDCGHEYHRECVKKWLHMKNTCPVCKSTALSSKGKKF